jgi:hypothetical protein
MKDLGMSDLSAPQIGTLVKRIPTRWWSRQLFQNLWRGLLLLAACASICACGDPFGPDSRELGGGYRLKRVGDPAQFALIIPHESGGLIIDEIGWYQPLIVARATGSEYWDAIDTSQARHTRISDAQRKLDSGYQKVEIEPVTKAWMRLQRNKRLW